MKKLIFILFILVSFTFESTAQKSAVFVKNNKAIDGYDPVAFFTENKPLKGVDSIEIVWNNATWLFSSIKNMEAFKKDPEKYAPQYGGYCAYGCSNGAGHKSPTQIETWSIIKGKLYFNYNAKVKELWQKNVDSFINKADSNWVSLKEN